MRLQRSLTIGLISTCISLAAWIAAPDMALAQGASNVSMVTLQVVPGASGGESVVTPKGMVVPLPGPGVNSGAIQIYMGSQGGYWYVDRNGQNVDLTSYVAQVRSMSAAQTQSVPQYAPAAEPVVINNQQTAPSSGSSGYNGAAMMAGTAAAAGLGAMAGSAMSNDYYHNNGYHGGYYGNVPYGTPVHYGAAGAKPYYVNGSGNTVNVNKSYTGGTATENNVNATKMDENQFNNAHASNMEAQQKWYQNQQKANPEQFKSWQQNSKGENPFVNKEAQSRYGGDAMTKGEAGRFGKEAEGGGGRLGGRFGGGEREAGGGGRLRRGR